MLALLILQFSTSIKFLVNLFQGSKKSRRKWSEEEVAAVEKSLMYFIRVGKIPRKKACERCLAASEDALAERDWKGVKCYVYNRILSDKRL